MNWLNPKTHIPRECREEFLPVNIPGADLSETRDIKLAGISSLSRGYVMNRRNCSFSVLICVLKGEGLCRYKESLHPLNKGDVLFLGAGQDHVYQTKGDWKIVWFHLGNRDWEKGAENFFIRHLPDQGWVLHSTALTYLRESRGEEEKSLLFTLGELLTQMISRILLLPYSGGSHSRDEIVINRLKREINKNISHSWSVEELAGLVDITPSYLYKITARTLGISPCEMVREIKFNLAEQLLTHSDYPLKFIAERIGYMTPYAFSKSFKKKHGVSPGIFRHRWEG